MRPFLLRLIISMLPFLAVSMAHATEAYHLDPTHSYVLWHINHFGFSNPSGKWEVSGDLILDEKNPKNSQIKAKVPIASLVTGIPKLDEHLKSADFFDVAKYPTATFISHEVKMTGKTTAKVYGDLTLHGKVKPVILNVKLNRIAVSPITHSKTAGFTAHTILKRSDFGIDRYLPGLGDVVKIDIEAEAILN